MDPQDVKIIESIPLSRFHKEDQDGWHFTNNGRCTAKSGYQVERVYPDREIIPPVYGPSVTALKAFFWKVRCPPKIKHFLWQLLTGCIAVKKKFRSRGMQGDIICDQCGALEESINHVFFECPPAIQVWALHESQRVRIYFPLNLCLPIWIIYFGESPRKWKIITLHGFYGIYGKEETIKYLAI